MTVQTGGGTGGTRQLPCDHVAKRMSQVQNIEVDCHMTPAGLVHTAYLPWGLALARVLQTATAG